jgi:hypothetical protein
VQEPAKIPDVYVFGPNGFRKPVPLKKISAGAFRGQVPIGNRQGLFRITPATETRLFPETGLYRQEEELSEYGSNEALLRNVAAFTGGRYSPSPDQVLDNGGRSVASTLQLWPGLLALAIALNLAELIIRKWRGIMEGLGWAKRI